MSQLQKYDLVFVLGHSHCGSTLLGRMLNRHPDLLCPGEFLWIDDALDKNLPCSCGLAMNTCPFWAEHLPRLPPKILKDYTQTRAADLHTLRLAANRKVLLDLSKSRFYRVPRLARTERMGLIFLARDPRALLASRLREGGELPHEIRKLRKWTGRFLDLIDDHQPDSMTLFYEDFVAQPEKTIRSICTFIGLEFRPELLQPGDQEHHFCHSSVSPYLKGKNEIRIDDRWRRELSPDQIALINRKVRKIPLYADRYDLNDSTMPAG
jgi:hypothetical protein